MDRKAKAIKADVLMVKRFKKLISQDTLDKIDGIRQWCIASIVLLVEAEKGSKIRLPEYEDYGIDEDFITNFCNRPIIDIGEIAQDTEDTGQGAGGLYEEDEGEDEDMP